MTGMSYVVYNLETTMILNRQRHKTPKAAKAALTRAFNKGEIANKFEWSVADSKTFHEHIEKTKIVLNLVSKEPVEIPVNTPMSCDPSSETYWSM